MISNDSSSSNSSSSNSSSSSSKELIVKVVTIYLVGPSQLIVVQLAVCALEIRTEAL